MQYQKNKLENLLQSCAGFVKCKCGCKLFKTLMQYQKIDWRNFYNLVQVSLNANADAKMTLQILNGYC